MRNPKRALDLAVLLPIGAILLFVPPYVGLADGTRTVIGIPTLHLYIFGVWGLGIVLTRMVARRLSALDDADPAIEADSDAPALPRADAPHADPPPADGDGI